jgi:porin
MSHRVRPISWTTTWLLASMAAFTCTNAALAAPPVLQAPTDESFQPDQNATGPFQFLNGLSRSNQMLGDMGGLRTELSKYGISFGLSETSEVLGNVTGGAKRGAAYDGLTQMLLQLDTRRAFGWYGGTFNASALQIHGTNLSADNLLTLQTSSGITADRSTRL